MILAALLLQNLDSHGGDVYVYQHGDEGTRIETVAPVIILESYVYFTNDITLFIHDIIYF